MKLVRVASARGAAVLVTALGLLVTAPQPAFAASVRVSPTTGLDPGGQTITVRGSGFDPRRNNKFGVYVVFGPRNADWVTNSNAYLSAKWVHPGGAGGGSGQAPMSASGSFSVTLSVKARYTDGDGKKVDCLKTQCYVITMAAHGVPDRSQDTFTPVSFKGGGSAGGSGSGSSGAAGPGGSAGSGGGKGGGASGSGAADPSAPGVPHGSAPGDAPGTPGATATPDASLAGASPAGAFEQTISGGEARSPWPFWAATAAAGTAVLTARSVLRRRPGRYARRRGAGPAS
ncbi:MAG TPA: IPT/TIG domain-containing protein [Vulgatibacteraceae bacterium]|nr:IPT/TIG domain-containing protein [Vulgatibacteraceae bacterium]